jgi:hypothetical protein
MLLGQPTVRLKYPLSTRNEQSSRSRPLYVVKICSTDQTYEAKSLYLIQRILLLSFAFHCQIQNSESKNVQELALHSRLCR